MGFDLDEEELKATRRLHGLDKEMSIEELEKQLEQKNKELEEYVMNKKNDCFSDKAEKLRQEIYILQDEIQLRKKSKEVSLEEDMRKIQTFLTIMKSDFRTALYYKEHLDAIKQVLAELENSISIDTIKEKIEEFEIKSVERIPNRLESGILYVCLNHHVAVHLCACGCREKTVTPLGLCGWNLIFNENGLSLKPSIGNFQIACNSHYFITNNKVEWC